MRQEDGQSLQCTKALPAQWGAKIPGSEVTECLDRCALYKNPSWSLPGLQGRSGLLGAPDLTSETRQVLLSTQEAAVSWVSWVRLHSPQSWMDS